MYKEKKKTSDNCFVSSSPEFSDSHGFEHLVRETYHGYMPVAELNFPSHETGNRKEKVARVPWSLSIPYS